MGAAVCRGRGASAGLCFDKCKQPLLPTAALFSAAPLECAEVSLGLTFAFGANSVVERSSTDEWRWYGYTRHTAL